MCNYGGGQVDHSRVQEEFTVINHLSTLLLPQMECGIDVPDVYNATSGLPLTEDSALTQYRSLVNHRLLAMNV